MHAIVAAALKQRILVIILAATLMVGGLFAYRMLNIEAYPDPVPPLRTALTELAANIRAGRTEHLCDAGFGRDVGHVAAEAQRQILARRPG